MENDAYVVIELQTSNGTTSVLTDSYTDKPAAEQKYHQVLSFAAVSEVQIHAVCIMTADGYVMKNEVYYHNQEPTE